MIESRTDNRWADAGDWLTIVIAVGLGAAAAVVTVRLGDDAVGSGIWLVTIAMPMLILGRVGRLRRRRRSRP